MVFPICSFRSLQKLLLTLKAYVYCPFQCLVSSVYSKRIFLPYIHVQSLADSSAHDNMLQGVTVQGMRNFILFSAFNLINVPVNSSAFRK